MIAYTLKNKEDSPATFHFAISALRIVFMGTPEFAVASLDAMLKAGNQVVGVITAPDKPSGRGMKMNESAVKKRATEKNIPILQPEKLKASDFLSSLEELHADLQVVVAFRMLPEVVWKMPPRGTINLHGSLLPQYRGAAPINWAIINGETETGVTTFQLQQEIDTGGILLQEKISIGENETAGELHDRMKIIGADLLVKTIQGLAEGTLVPKAQEVFVEEKTTGESGSIVSAHSSLLKTAPKINSATCQIDWTKSVHQIHNLIRGLSPHPGAFTELGDKTLKIFRSEKELSLPTSRMGRWESDKKTFLKFACADGYILLTEVQLEGKKKMMIDEFLRGYRF